APSGPGPLPQRGGDAPGGPVVDPDVDPRHRRDHRPDRRRRLDRPHRRGRPRARRHPLRPARPQPGSGPVLPRRGPAGARARRRHPGQHRRRQPVPAGAHRRPGAADPRRPRRHRHRRPPGAPGRALLRPEGAAAEARQPHRQPGREHRPARRGQRLPRLLARLAHAAEHDHALQLLHGDDHPGRQQEAGHREHPDPHQPQDARVAAVLEHLPARAEVGGGHRARLHHVQAVRHLQLLRGAVRCARAGPVRALRGPQGRRRRGQPPAVAARRHRPARHELHVGDRRHPGRPAAHQPRAHRGHPRAHQEAALRPARPQPDGAGRAVRARGHPAPGTPAGGRRHGRLAPPRRL
ncbi:MAG: Glycosyl transferase, family 2, partial [uncultured Frankineae bacterium]